jgi:hypothetical protein
MKIALQRGQFLRVVNGAGSTVTAHGGSVWITEQDNPRDVVLRAGQNVTLRRSGVALVEAFEDASIFLEGTAS